VAKKNGVLKSSASNSGLATFINYRLDDDDKAWLAACDLTTEFPLERLFGLAQEGYKISISPPRDNRSAIVSLVDVEPTSPFYNHALSGFGATVIDAWYSLAYRHFVKAAGNWSAFPQTSDTDVSRFG
jgi:hypothetical protein